MKKLINTSIVFTGDTAGDTRGRENEGFSQCQNTILQRACLSVSYLSVFRVWLKTREKSLYRVERQKVTVQFCCSVGNMERWNSLLAAFTWLDISSTTCLLLEPSWSFCSFRHWAALYFGGVSCWRGTAVQWWNSVTPALAFAAVTPHVLAVWERCWVARSTEDLRCVRCCTTATWTSPRFRLFPNSENLRCLDTGWANQGCSQSSPEKNKLVAVWLPFSCPHRLQVTSPCVPKSSFLIACSHGLSMYADLSQT